MLMKNRWFSDAPFSLDRANIQEFSSYIHLEQEINMIYNPSPAVCRRKRAAWVGNKSIEGVMKKTKQIWFREHLSNFKVLPALAYASETCYMSMITMRSAYR